MADPVLDRVAIRKFLDKKVASEDIKKLIAAFQAAPCGMHQTEVMRLTVVTNDELRAELEKASDNAFYHAPVLMEIHTKKDSPFGARDASAAAENIMIEATSLGLGSVYILGGVFKINGNDTIKHELEIPADYESTVVVAVGYAAETPQEDRSKRYQVIVK